MKWINYHHLIYFKEIAAQESVSKAAEVLKVGQPALSSQLKNLEEYLGVKLFERKKRKIFLTEPGKVVLEYANKINSLGQELMQLIDDKVFTNEIHLSIGALDSIPKHLICDIVDLAHKKTDCFLSIYEDSPDALVRSLLAHQIEVMISDQEITRFQRDNIYSKKILHQPIFAYASEDFKHLKRNFPKSLDGVPCIVPTVHSKIRTSLDHYFHSNGIRPKLIAETQDTSLQKILATRGDGVIFLPGFTAKELVYEKKLSKLGKLKEVYSEYFLVYSERIIENPALDLILKQNFERMT
jgi:LysR family transcriptional activator of nhaA